MGHKLQGREMHQKTVNIKEFLRNRQRLTWLRKKRFKSLSPSKFYWYKILVIFLIFHRHNLEVFWPRTQEGVCMLSELKPNQTFLLQSYICKDTTNNSRSESLWETSKTDAYGDFYGTWHTSVTQACSVFNLSNTCGYKMLPHPKLW